MLVFLKENSVFIYKENHKMLPTSMLVFLATSKVSVNTVYNEVIDDIQYQVLFTYVGLVYKPYTLYSCFH